MGSMVYSLFWVMQDLYHQSINMGSFLFRVPLPYYIGGPKKGPSFRELPMCSGLGFKVHVRIWHVYLALTLQVSMYVQYSYTDP